jgi:hypothetical protein
VSIELSPTKFEIRDDATDGLVMNHATKLIPIVQKVELSNVDVAFPDVSFSTYGIMNTQTKGASDAPPTGTPPESKAWRAYAWGLRIDAGVQQGSINLVAITPGLAPNSILGNIRVVRTIAGRDDVFGPFFKRVLENTWQPIRSGACLEFCAWMRRIIWFDIADGYLRLNWKQSTMGYNPNQLDPNEVFWNRKWITLSVPPAYQIGSYYRESTDGSVFAPPVQPAPSPHSGPKGTIRFNSTWRFTNINLWLGQL